MDEIIKRTINVSVISAITASHPPRPSAPASQR